MKRIIPTSNPLNTKKNRISYILGIGSNLPIPEKNIIKALILIKNQKDIKLLKFSSLYLSEPFGYKGQPIFINCAALIETDLFPLELLKKLKKIEKTLGRVKTFKNGPRKIDIDILLCSDYSVNYKKLKIPHKKFQERAFEFLPALEIAPDFRNPLSNKTLKEISKDISFKIKAYKSIKAEII